jgi:hypothetical protein
MLYLLGPMVILGLMMGWSTTCHLGLRCGEYILVEESKERRGRDP